MSQVTCRFTQCIHNKGEECTHPHIFVDNTLHLYPECMAAEIMGYKVKKKPRVNIIRVASSVDEDIWHDSEFYQITQIKHNNTTRGFKLAFYPKVQVNRYLPTIIDETATYHSPDSLPIPWPNFNIMTSHYREVTPEQMKKMLEAYQAALDTIEVVKDFWKEGGPYVTATDVRECSCEEKQLE